MKLKLLISTLLLLCLAIVNAQEKELEEQKEFAEKKHSIAILLSHTQMAESIGDGKKKWISIPSWGIDYNYELSEKWAVGLHNDIILENFIVEHNDKTEIERSSPFASTVVVLYKLGNHISVMLGILGA